MQDHWRRFGPPVYVSVAAAVGYEAKADPAAKGGASAAPTRGAERVRAVDDLDGFVRAFQGAGGTMQ